ncbi:MAG: SH3 domain-containing protein, partial [bacterium]
MQTRILKIRAGDPALRKQRLGVAKGWMEEHGWVLLDYSDELGSALFERAANAPKLAWKDPTRWLPAPDWFNPREWLAGLLARPRRIAFAAAVAGAVLAGFVGVLSTTSVAPGGGDATEIELGAETWLFVNADALNVRASPSTGAQIVGVLYRNQR